VKIVIIIIENNKIIIYLKTIPYRYRDSFDELAKNVKSYADDEEINESLSNGLKSFTNAVTIMGDYMDINVHRLEHKVQS